MGKAKTTVVTCDGPKCDTHVMADDAPDEWLRVRIGKRGTGEFEHLLFCEYACLSGFAYDRAAVQLAMEGVPDDAADEPA